MRTAQTPQALAHRIVRIHYYIDIETRRRLIYSLPATELVEWYTPREGSPPLLRLHPHLAALLDDRRKRRPRTPRRGRIDS